MNLFKKNLSAVESEAAQLTETNEQLVKDLAEAQALALPNTEALATLTNANAVLETKLADSDKALEASTIAQADFDGKVAAAAAKQVSDSGMKPEKIDADDNRELSVIEQMNALEGAEKSAFYKENKSAILALHAIKN